MPRRAASLIFTLFLSCCAFILFYHGFTGYAMPQMRYAAAGVTLSPQRYDDAMLQRHDDFAAPADAAIITPLLMPPPFCSYFRRRRDVADAVCRASAAYATLICRQRVCRFADDVIFEFTRATSFSLY